MPHLTTTSTTFQPVVMYDTVTVPREVRASNSKAVLDLIEGRINALTKRVRDLVQSNGFPASLSDIKVNNEVKEDPTTDRFIYSIEARWPYDGLPMTTVTSVPFYPVKVFTTGVNDPVIPVTWDVVPEYYANVALLHALLDEAMPNWREVYGEVSRRQKTE